MAEYIVREIDYHDVIKMKKIGVFVRCKNCKFYDDEDFFCHYWENLHEHAKSRPRITPFDYCSRGIRKETKNE